MGGWVGWRSMHPSQQCFQEVLVGSKGKIGKQEVSGWKAFWKQSSTTLILKITLISKNLQNFHSWRSAPISISFYAWTSQSAPDLVSHSSYADPSIRNWERCHGWRITPCLNPRIWRCFRIYYPKNHLLEGVGLGWPWLFLPTRYTFPTIKHAAMENDHRLDLQSPLSVLDEVCSLTQVSWSSRVKGVECLPHIPCRYHISFKEYFEWTSKGSSEDKFQTKPSSWVLHLFRVAFVRPISFLEEFERAATEDDRPKQNPTVHPLSSLQANRMWSDTQDAFDRLTSAFALAILSCFWTSLFGLFSAETLKILSKSKS